MKACTNRNFLIDDVLSRQTIFQSTGLGCGSFEGSARKLGYLLGFYSNLNYSKIEIAFKLSLINTRESRMCWLTQYYKKVHPLVRILFFISLK